MKLTVAFFLALLPVCYLSAQTIMADPQIPDGEYIHYVVAVNKESYSLTQAARRIVKDGKPMKSFPVKAVESGGFRPHDNRTYRV